MATFALVHGGWSGGWIWKYVTPLLRAAEHEVYTPTLTGCGERVHLAHPDIDLDTHIQDIVNVLTYEDLRDVVLVGWSYGGMVNAGVAGHVPERLAHLVMLDSPYPLDGQSGADYWANEAWWQKKRAQTETEGDGWRVLPGTYAELHDAFPDEAIRSWYAERTTAQPLKTWTQPVRRPVFTIPRTYIRCIKGISEEERAKDWADLALDPDWRYWEIDAGHLDIVKAPQEIATVLLKVIE